MKKITLEELKNAMERMKEREGSFEEMMNWDDPIRSASNLLVDLGDEIGGLFMNLDVDIPTDYALNEDQEEIGYRSPALDKYIIWSYGWDIPEDEDEFLEDVLEYENQIREFESRIIFVRSNN